MVVDVHREQIEADVLRSAADAIIAVDLDGRFIAWNRAAERMYGWHEDEVLGRHVSLLSDPGHRTEQAATYSDARAGHLVGPVEVMRVDRQGRARRVEMTLSPLADEDGTQFGIMAVHRDASTTTELRHAVVQAEQRLSAVVEAMPEALVVMDSVRDESGAVVDFVYDHVNAAFCDLVGEQRDDLLGHRLLELFPSHLELGLFDSYVTVVETGETFVAELPWFSERNLHGFIEVTAKRFNGGFIATGRNITDRKQAEERRMEEALTDPLTGLGNRRMLIDRIRHDLTRLGRDGGELAVLFVDLDHFKGVNDTLGHDIGDEVLEEVARRLTAQVRPSDTVCRIGGDEFVVVLPRTHSRRDPAAIAQRIIDAVAEPIATSAHEVRLGASVGITTADGPGNAEDLVRQADLAMYRAKRRHGDRYEYFDDQISAEVHQRVQTEQGLRAAVERGEFEPWFQPQVDLRTGRVVGFETLARWRRADGDVVPAAEWVEVAESTGLITRLDRLLRAQACQEFATWERVGVAALIRLWLNVSARELVEPDTAEVLLRTITASGLAPADVGIEVTETALVADPDAAAANIDLLVGSGVRIAVDDFGTGFASLASLRDLQVDTLKIDRSFTQGVPGSEFDDAVVAATVALSNSLELGIIGEGIETHTQREALIALVCSTGQGYLFAPPLPAEEAAPLVAGHALV